jgi:UDP-N-acetyl-D-galactosamine dehydrogenase
VDSKEPSAVIAVIGLGYVGLPLALEFAKTRQVIGFDISERRVKELRGGRDHTLEASAEQLSSVAAKMHYTADPMALSTASIYIVTVPTPIDAAKQPDLGPVRSASELIGRVLAPGDLVIYESTVYPGATEEVCVPILAAESGLAFNKGFFVGYSPERINPGDHVHRLPDIMKVTSGSTPEIAEQVDALYREIITAGTHCASSIRVAEAAKVIENTQRDVNIALVNELALLFGRMDIDTHDVLAAAGTKWNFLPFTPGLVGGHCIGVDPYYLTHKAAQVGHHSEVILAGRRINDAMGEYIADQLVLLLARKGVTLSGARVLILGLAFKESTPDIRNTRVVDIDNKLREYGIHVDLADPWVDPAVAKAEYGIDLVDADAIDDGAYDAIVLAVAHEQFRSDAARMRKIVGEDGVLFDVKAAWPRELVDARL